MFFPLKRQLCFSFKKANELLRGEDGAEFDIAIFFNDAEPLARLKIKRFTDLLGDDDLVFG
jgi:hypothetical protein